MGSSRFSFIKIVFSILLLVGLPVFIWAVLTQRIELRKQANVTGPTIDLVAAAQYPNGISGDPGQEFSVAALLNPRTASVSGAVIHLAYDPAVIQVEEFTPGTLLPVVLSAPVIDSSAGTVAVTLGAQPDSPMKTAGNIGTLKFKLLTTARSGILVENTTIVTVIGNPTNALVGVTGIEINGGGTPTTTPVVGCTGNPDGTACRIPLLEGGQNTGMIAGTCQNSQCQPSDVSSTPSSSITKVGVVERYTTATVIGYVLRVSDNELYRLVTRTGPTEGYPFPTGPYDQLANMTVTAYGNIVANPGGYDGPSSPYFVALQVTAPGTTGCSPNGAACTSSCPICVGNCPRSACVSRPGVCQNNVCTYSTPTPAPHNWCAGPDNTLCQYDCNSCDEFGRCTQMGCRDTRGICRSNLCRPIPSECRYRTMECIQAPCPVELVCTAITPTPTPPPGCIYTTACTDSYPSDCRPRLVCPTTYPSPSISPVPPTYVCSRKAPTVTISPTNQSGNPGQTLTYLATITNNDTFGCGDSQFTYTTRVPQGFSSHAQVTAMTLPPTATTNVSFSVVSPVINNNTATQSVPVSLYATNTASHLEASADVAYTFVKPIPVTFTFRFRFAGVDGPEAVNETVNMSFKYEDGTEVIVAEPIQLYYEGAGIYQALYTLTNPAPPGTRFTAQLKGPKHAAIRFCEQSGQTDVCQPGRYLTISSSTTFDFTQRPLPAGDLDRNGYVTAADLKFVSDLLFIPSSQHSTEDIKRADVNYDGHVTNLDLNLIVQSLVQRQDE